MADNCLTVRANSKVELRRTLDFYVGNHFQGQLLFTIPGNVNAAKYMEIRDALAAENESRGRNDAIANPRRGPDFEAPPSVTIRSVRGFNTALASRGTDFCCHIPDSLPWNLYQQIADLARRNNVQLDTWTT